MISDGGGAVGDDLAITGGGEECGIRPRRKASTMKCADPQCDERGGEEPERHAHPGTSRRAAGSATGSKTVMCTRTPASATYNVAGLLPIPPTAIVETFESDNRARSPTAR